MIVKKKLPQNPSDLLNALENLDPTKVPLGNIQSLVTNWPDDKNQSFNDLVAKANAYPQLKW